MKRFSPHSKTHHLQDKSKLIQPNHTGKVTPSTNPPQILLTVFSNKNKNYPCPITGPFISTKKKEKKNNGSTKTGINPRSKLLSASGYLWRHIFGISQKISLHSRINKPTEGEFPTYNSLPQPFLPPVTSQQRNTRRWWRHRVRALFPIESMTFFVCVVTAHKHLCPQSSFRGWWGGEGGSVG